MDDESSVHFQWISLMANRILQYDSSDNAKPLLCLSFETPKQHFQGISAFPKYPTIEILKNGCAYAIVSSLFQNINISENIPEFNFQQALTSIENIGYRPQEPCTISGLVNGSILDHVNLCKIFEFVVSDKTITIDMLTSDLRRLPRSFFVLKESPNFLDEAMNLWLTKFSCNLQLSDIKDPQDLRSGSHIASIFSRIFPSKVDKKLIKTSDDLSAEQIKENWSLVKPIVDELGVFSPESIPNFDKLFMCYVSDIYHATRSGAKRFIKLDPPPPPQISIKKLDYLRPSTSCGNKPIDVPKITVPTTMQPLKLKNRESRPKTAEPSRRKIITHKNEPSEPRSVRREQKFVRIKNPSPPPEPVDAHPKPIFSNNNENDLKNPDPEITPPIVIPANLSFPESQASERPSQKKKNLMDISLLDLRPQTPGSLKEKSPGGSISTLTEYALVSVSA